MDIQEVLPERPNVLASLIGKNGGKQLIFNGHTDVVPAGEGWKRNPFEASIVDDKIIGRGAADMKGGLAAMIIALIAIKRAGIKLDGDLFFHAVIDEEVASNGTKSIINEGFKADYAIVGEPTNLSICIAQKGRLVVRITTYGKATHASTPEKGVNAISAMIDVLNKIILYGKELDRMKHPLLGSPTQAITVIKGGIKSNIVPNTCEVIIDRRVIPGENIESIKEEYRKISKNQGVLSKIDFIEHEAESSQVSTDELIVKVSHSAMKDVVGRAKIMGFPAITDAYLLNKAGIATIVLGPGSINQAHSPNEYVRIPELIYAAKIYALTAIRLLKE